MNALLVQKTKSESENNENSVVEGVFICINCGSIHTTVMKKAVYCRDCRSFRLITKKTQEGPDIMFLSIWK
jgi:DNA-directed RNA polymerase subunit RPC12/RpoP